MLKEYKLEDSNPVADLKNKLWQALDIIRGSISLNDSYFLLYLLVLQRDGLFFELKSLSQDDIKNQIRNCILNSEKDNSEILIELYPVFEPNIHLISDRAIYQLINILKSLNQKILKEHFSDIFDDFLIKLSNWQGKFGGGYVLPLEISQFVCALAALPEKAKVYNPFAGVASFGVFLDDGLDYLGQEINKMTWAIGYLRILAYERVGETRFIQSDSISQWNPTPNEKFDLIVASPPFGMKLSEITNGINGRFRNCEQFFIEKGIEDLTANGKLIAIIPQGFLFRLGSEQELRRFIIENDLLEMVISLPAGLIMNTGIPITIFVINKNKKDKGFVSFIDAKSFVVSLSPKEKQLNNYALNSFVKNQKESEFRRIVSNDTIRQFEYNLNVPLYFQKEYDGVTLGEVGTITRGQRVPEGQFGKFIRIRDLKDDRLHFNLDIDYIESVEIPRHAKKIEESCVLLVCRWKTLKPTFFNFSGIPIYISSDIVAYKIDETKIDIGFFISELNTASVSEQIDSYRIGDTIPSIKPEDLLRIKIQVPSHSEQVEKKLLAQKEFLNIEEQKLNQLRKDTGLDVADQNSFLRHQIAGPLRNIRSSAKNIRGILDKYLPEMIPDFYNLKLDDSASLTLGKYFEILERDLKAINKSTQKTGIDIELKEFNISRIDIIQFIKAYYSELKEQINKIFDLELTILDDDFDINNVNKVFINGDIELIRKMFNNLIENAEKHAFENNYSIKNRIEIILVFDFEKMEIEIDFINNQKPIEKGFTIEKFIRKGMKVGKNGGDGFGLYYVNEIIKIHGGKLNFYDYRSTVSYGKDWVSSFDIKFPIEIENNSDDEI